MALREGIKNFWTKNESTIRYEKIYHKVSKWKIQQIKISIKSQTFIIIKNQAGFILE